MYKELCLAYQDNTLSFREFAQIQTMNELNLFQLLEDAKSTLKPSYIDGFKCFVQCYNTKALIWDKIQ